MDKIYYKKLILPFFPVDIHDKSRDLVEIMLFITKIAVESLLLHKAWDSN